MFVRRFPLWDENSGDNQGSSGPEDNSALKDEIQRLRNHNSKLLDEKKQVQQSLKRFEGIDPDEVKKMMSVFDSNEEARLLAENKLDEVVNKRTEKTRLERDQIKAEFDDYKVDNERETKKWKDKYAKSVIENAIRREAEKAKIEPHFIDYALFKSDGMFSLDDDGNIEARDTDGNIITVKKKPLSPEVFIEQLKINEPHLWPDSKGAGASGGTGNGGLNEVNPFIPNTPAFSLTEQAKLFNKDPEKAKMLQEVAKQYQPPMKQ